MPDHLESDRINNVTHALHITKKEFAALIGRSVPALNKKVQTISVRGIQFLTDVSPKTLEYLIGITDKEPIFSPEERADVKRYINSIKESL